MQKQFEIHLATRNNIIKAIEHLSEEQMNTIPEGFNNNIIWNVAHVLVSQQLLCYKMANQEMSLDESFIDLFKKGSEADYEVSDEETAIIKEELLVLSAKMEEDYNSGLFENYNAYPTSYNVTLNSIEEAIQFNNVHEGLHFGYIMALKKAL
jgi:hypothetical protein